MRLLTVAVFSSVAVVFAVVVRADTPPSVWERARDVGVAEAYDLHHAVQQRLIRTRITEIDFGERERVLAMLERAGAERSKSAPLRFDLGRVHFELGNHPRAAQVYKAALSEFPDHPGAEQAWLHLAFACGHLGDHPCERDAYVEVLRRETEDIVRATPTLNLAETQMHLGDLKGAIEGYREALRLASRVPARETAPLATWGLAVALDRSGDRATAEKEARFAIEIEQSMGVQHLLHSADVFFVPRWEVHWYDGLGAAARARVALSARDALPLWQQAERSFRDYVIASEASEARTEATRDPWLSLAKVRFAEAKVERERVEKAAAREAPKPVPTTQDVAF